MLQPLRLNLHCSHISFNHPNTLGYLVIAEFCHVLACLVCKQLGISSFVGGYDAGIISFCGTTLLRVHWI